MFALPVDAEVVDAHACSIHGPDEARGLPGPGPEVDLDAGRPDAPSIPGLVDDLGAGTKRRDGPRLAAGPREPAPPAKRTARDRPLDGPAQGHAPDHEERGGPGEDHPGQPVTAPEGPQPAGLWDKPAENHPASQDSGQPRVRRDAPPRSRVQPDWSVRRATRVDHVSLPIPLRRRQSTTRRLASAIALATPLPIATRTVVGPTECTDSHRGCVRLVGDGLVDHSPLYPRPPP